MVGKISSVNSDNTTQTILIDWDGEAPRKEHVMGRTMLLLGYLVSIAVGACFCPVTIGSARKIFKIPRLRLSANH
jgi:hypothetical protein